MTTARAKIRLFVEAGLGPGQVVELSKDQAHYLFSVMRQAEGDQLRLFNGRDGEWLAEITAQAKRGGAVTCLAPSAQQRMPPDLWLLFAPIKKARTDFIVEKAAEMGASRILPVITRFTNSERLRTDRLRAHAIEAAEQCEGTYVPEVFEPQQLQALLEDWPGDRKLMFCDEARTARPAFQALTAEAPGKWAILIGPEGGFEAEEAARLREMAQVVPVTLGPRILRADTAAVAALAVWQAVLGDWK